VSFDREVLLRRLSGLEDFAERPQRFVVALSGGLDSSVLLHALASGRTEHGLPILAVHVDHGLQSESASWADQCEEFATQLGVEFVRKRAVVDLASGTGMEAAARQARYDAMRPVVEAGDWLLSAHHLDDQAETVLYNLMRGSGTAGLAGMAGARRLGGGWLVRPLLDVPRCELQDYADEHSIRYVTDPSNIDDQFDRNYLRLRVLPQLERRWPDAAARIRRSARLAREATTLLAELAEIDRRNFADRSDRLAVPELARLPAERQRNLIRYLILELGLPSPGAVHLEQIVNELVNARIDAQPLVAWPGARARRYRDRLYLLRDDNFDEAVNLDVAMRGKTTVLPGGLGQLELYEGATIGLADAVVDAGLEIRQRTGGEEILVHGQRHTKKLKKLLQEEGVVPWMRDRLPLIYAGAELVAVADLWIADNAASAPGTGIRWVNRPPLH
jgi:tRNA(Ile)-lysidine synthase